MGHTQVGDVKEFKYQEAQARTEKVNGGKRYIPLSALEALGAVFEEGALKYGEHNWKNGVGDRAYQMERWEHADTHLRKWVEGDRTENHLAKVMWFCATQIELERLEEEEEKRRAGVWRSCEDPGSAAVRAKIDEQREFYTLLGQLRSEIKALGLDRLTMPATGLAITAADGNTSNHASTVEEKETKATGVAGKKITKTAKAVKKTARVLSEEGKERIAAAQRRRWARVRREKKAQEKGGK